MFRLTTLALLISSATCAWAQEDSLTLPAGTITASADEPVDSTRLDLDAPIASGSRLNLSARENPASVSVADRQTMQRIGARNFQDAANALPGVNASAPPGWGGFVAYRGFTGAQIGQLFNGINLQYGAAGRPVGAWIYDRVELLGGPSSFLNGSGAVGGRLNFITRLASRDEDSFEGRVSYGRYDTRETAIGLNKALNDGDGPRHYARLDYSRTANNGYIDRQENDAGNLAFSLLSDFNDRLSHTLAIEYLEEQEDSPYWGTPVLRPLGGTLHIDQHDRFANYNVEDGRYEQRTRWLRSITDYRFSDTTQLRNTLYHYDGQRDYRNLEVYRYSDDNRQVLRSGGYRQRHDQEVNGDRIELTHAGELFGLASDWAFGLDYNRNQQTNYPLSKGAFDTVTPGSFEPGHFLDIPGMDAPLVAAVGPEPCGSWPCQRWGPIRQLCRLQWPHRRLPHLAAGSGTGAAQTPGGGTGPGQRSVRRRPDRLLQGALRQLQGAALPGHRRRLRKHRHDRLQQGAERPPARACPEAVRPRLNHPVTLRENTCARSP